MPDEHRFRDRSPETEARAQVCLNCGAPISGPFCAACGQRDIPPYPSVRELAMDAIAEFSGWDGRLASTLRALVRHPGMLTHEFLEGRRVRYISPLRVYLLASLAYFLLAASAPEVRLESGETVGLHVGMPKREGNQPASRPERVATAVSGSLEKPGMITSAEKDSALKDIAKAPAVMQPFLRRAVSDPVGFKRGLLQTMPRMLFVLLPIFAGIVALFYHGRKYPEHLYFAIHLHAFMFLALAAAAVTKFTQIPVVVAVASLIATCWIPVYATLAFRRVYGGSIARTLIKEAGIAVIYAVAAAVGFIVLIYWVSIAA